MAVNTSGRNILMSRLNVFLLFIGIIAAGCGKSPEGRCEDNPLIRQRVVTHLTTNGWLAVELESLVGTHAVGIVVSDKMWDVLSKAIGNDPPRIQVEVAQNKTGDIQMFAVKLGLKGTSCDHIPGCRYFFSLVAHSSVPVRIKLPVEGDWLREEGVSIIVMKDPRETEW